MGCCVEGMFLLGFVKVPQLLTFRLSRRTNWQRSMRNKVKITKMIQIPRTNLRRVFRSEKKSEVYNYLYFLL
jgi:hypothetical protein